MGASSAVEIGEVGEGLAVAVAWAVGAGSTVEVGEVGGGQAPSGGGGGRDETRHLVLPTQQK